MPQFRAVLARVAVAAFDAVAPWLGLAFILLAAAGLEGGR